MSLGLFSGMASLSAVSTCSNRTRQSVSSLSYIQALNQVVRKDLGSPFSIMRMSEVLPEPQVPKMPRVSGVLVLGEVMTSTSVLTYGAKSSPSFSVGRSDRMYDFASISLP